VVLRDIFPMTTRQGQPGLAAKRRACQPHLLGLAMQKDEQDPLALRSILSAVVFAGPCAFWSEAKPIAREIAMFESWFQPMHVLIMQFVVLHVFEPIAVGDNKVSPPRALGSLCPWVLEEHL